MSFEETLRRIAREEIARALAARDLAVVVEPTEMTSHESSHHAEETAARGPSAFPVLFAIRRYARACAHSALTVARNDLVDEDVSWLLRITEAAYRSVFVELHTLLPAGISAETTQRIATFGAYLEVYASAVADRAHAERREIAVLYDGILGATFKDLAAALRDVIA